MRRLTLSPILQWTSLVAILLIFTQTEGCGTPYSMVESLSFTSDDSGIAVAKLNARDARVSMKRYKANVSRTISWLDGATGRVRETIHQDFKPGNCGPATALWWVGRASVACNPATDQIAMTAFGGGDVTRNLGTGQAHTIGLGHKAFNVVCSRSGRYFAARSMEELTVIDTQGDSVVMRVKDDDYWFIPVPLMSFTSDDTRIVVADRSDIHVWDVATSAQVATVVEGLESKIESIAVVADGSVIVCTGYWVRRYDMTGQLLATLAEEGAGMCSVSSDGNRLCVIHDDQLTVFDLESNSRLMSLPFSGVTSMAMANRGGMLAVGDWEGKVTLLDITSGAQLWISDPPGRQRWPWTVPAAMLIAWCYVVRRFHNRSSEAKGDAMSSADEPPG